MSVDTATRPVEAAVASEAPKGLEPITLDDAKAQLRALIGRVAAAYGPTVTEKTVQVVTAEVAGDVRGLAAETIAPLTTGLFGSDPETPKAKPTSEAPRAAKRTLTEAERAEKIDKQIDWRTRRPVMLERAAALQLEIDTSALDTAKLIGEVTMLRIQTLEAAAAGQVIENDYYLNAGKPLPSPEKDELPAPSRRDSRAVYRADRTAMQVAINLRGVVGQRQTRVAGLQKSAAKAQAKFDAMVNAPLYTKDAYKAEKRERAASAKFDAANRELKAVLAMPPVETQTTRRSRRAVAAMPGNIERAEATRSAQVQRAEAARRAEIQRAEKRAREAYLAGDQTNFAAWRRELAALLLTPVEVKPVDVKVAVLKLTARSRRAVAKRARQIERATRRANAALSKHSTAISERNRLLGHEAAIPGHKIYSVREFLQIKLFGRTLWGGWLRLRRNRVAAMREQLTAGGKYREIRDAANRRPRNG